MLKQQRPDGDCVVTQFTVCASIAPACIMIAVATKSDGATVIILGIVLDCVLTENIACLPGQELQALGPPTATKIIANPLPGGSNTKGYIFEEPVESVTCKATVASG
jgi:hypothetical protein